METETRMSDTDMEAEVARIMLTRKFAEIISIMCTTTTRSRAM